ncbi:DNA polymerase I [Candidatus Uhrbacteria bacterium]|nr:DNA polymerase I [Candidatus Uhrbacteria bacterium]
MANPASPLLLIVDGSSLLHRAYHALPSLTAPDGRLVNAAYGFLTMFVKALTDLAPTHVAVTFDLPGGTFRNELFPAYQAQREEKPDELYAQIPIIRGLLDALRVPVVEVDGYEADDAIGTIVSKTEDGRQKTKDRVRVIILTGDKDLLQLVEDGVAVVLLRRGMTDTARYDAAAVMERFGFPPERMPDFKALAGDPSDNYPGVPGIGEKTATELVRAFGGVEEVLKNAKCKMQNAKLPPPLTPKLAKRLCDHAEDARLGLRLSTIVRDVPMDFALSHCERREYDRDAVIAQLRELGFTSLLARLPVSGGASRGQESGDPQAGTPNQESGKRSDTVPTIEALSSVTDIRRVFADARKEKTAALAVVADGDDPQYGHPRAFGIAFDGRAMGLHPWGTALAEGRALLLDAAVAKDAHGAKQLLHALRRSRLDLAGFRYDTEIMSYLLAPGARNHDLAHVAFTELGVEVGQESGTDVEERQRAAERAAQEASIVARLVPVLLKKVEDAGLTRVYEEFDRPLIPVLQRMEAYGVRLDTEHLASLGTRMTAELEMADRAITDLAGEPFNIDSPQQLKRILFEKLGIAVRGIKKTAKGGALSTAAAELEKLRGAHPIIEHLFAHRELAKLLSTYVEALPALVDPTTGRIHTTYHQTVTATGRLSSSDPNLQNIPVTEPWGLEIRRAFIAEDGWRILALDYSQFELRIAAALSGDRVLTRAFRSGADIHAATGAEVFGVAPEDVTRDQRRVAKAINFGILYGMGANALATSASISRSEAEEYIARYFQVYAGLAEWIETTKALARSRGYVETLFGRKRFLPEIASGVPQVRAAAERMAVNMPIQGTQADLLKRAMIRADEWIRSPSSFRAKRGISHDGEAVRMVLTVHDELVFEVREDFVADATHALTDILEHVHALAVPIVVEAKVGRSWGQMSPV